MTILPSRKFTHDHTGKGQLSTELTISSEEFDVYDIYETPTTIAFHLREFNVRLATILPLLILNVLSGNHCICRLDVSCPRTTPYRSCCTAFY